MLELNKVQTGKESIRFQDLSFVHRIPYKMILSTMLFAFSFFSENISTTFSLEQTSRFNTMLSPRKKGRLRPESEISAGEKCYF